MMSRHTVFDRRLLRGRALRAAALGPSAFLLEQVAHELRDRLETVVRHFDLAVDLGTLAPTLRYGIAQSGRIGTIVAANACAGSRLEEARSDEAHPCGLALAADEEALPFREASLDLVVSALSLQFVNDLPGTLVQIRRSLKPDGLLLAALAGGDTLVELRQSFAAAEIEIEDGVSPRVIPFVDVRQAGALLQRAGFALPVVDVDRLIVRYDSPIALMRDLRRMGATNPLVERSRRPLKRATLQRMAEVYADRFADPDHRIPATFEIIWLSGWGPDSSQQKPLRPGSARARLADALGVNERSAGEKAKPDDRGQRTEDR
jgi:SAM-dependent methyltransferase